jgi:hypothetical protein
MNQGKRACVNESCWTHALQAEELARLKEHSRGAANALRTAASMGSAKELLNGSSWRRTKSIADGMSEMSSIEIALAEVSTDEGHPDVEKGKAV